jgi:glycosyltransferase involved in cell wall biosynthesis
MKILFFLHYPNPFPGAGWIRIEFFAHHFKKKGSEVAIAGAFSLSTIKKFGSKRMNGIKIINIIPTVMISNILSLAFNIISSFFASLVSLLLTRPETVVISVPNGEAAFGSYIAIKLFRVKRVVFDYRDEWEDYIINRVKSRIYKKAYRYLKNLMTNCYINSDLVITTTDRFARKLTSRGVRNVVVVSNGADTNIFRPRDKAISRKSIHLNEYDFILVYSGSGASYYRLDVLVRAMRRIANKVDNMKLLIVGEGSTINEALDLSKQIDLSSMILYLGNKTDKIELAKIYSASDIGIVPYDANPLWKNSIPVKALEYLACGLPIIATVYDDSVLGKLISENNVGVIAKPEDADSLAQAIEAMYDCHYRNKLGNNVGERNDQRSVTQIQENAVRLIRKKFDRNEIAEQLLILLKNTDSKNNSR